MSKVVQGLKGRSGHLFRRGEESVEVGYLGCRKREKMLSKRELAVKKLKKK